MIRSNSTWKEGPQILDLRNGKGERHVNEKVNEQIIVKVGGPHSPQQMKENSEQVKHEDLGTQTIEGVSAQGKRETVTIPAGEIGN